MLKAPLLALAITGAASTAAVAQQPSRPPPIAQSVPTPVRAYAPETPLVTGSDVIIVTDPEGPQKMALDKPKDGEPEQKGPSKKGTLEDPDYIMAIESLHLLSPEQLRDMKRRAEERDLAIADRNPPDSTTRTIPVTMRPGTAPATILLSDNYLTALTLIDSEGAPWPIAVAQPGNPELFEVTIAGKDQATDAAGDGTAQAFKSQQNVLILTPRQKYAASNLFIMPVGASAPIMLDLRTTREISYFNASLVVDERGPMAKDIVASRPAVPVDSGIMRRVLDGAGALAQGARQITVTGAPDTTAFIVGSQMYLRTPYTLVFPGWIADIKGRGMRVYEMNANASLLTVLDANGREIDLTVDNATILDAAIAHAASSREATGAIR